MLTKGQGVGRGALAMTPPKTLSQRLAAALDALGALGYPQHDLERRLGLSRSYLGTCRPESRTQRKPARHLVLLLEALVRHPADIDLIA